MCTEGSKKLAGYCIVIYIYITYIYPAKPKPATQLVFSQISFRLVRSLRS